MTLGASRSRFGHLGEENAVFLSVTGITDWWPSTGAKLCMDCTVRIIAIITAVLPFVYSTAINYRVIVAP